MAVTNSNIRAKFGGLFCYSKAQVTCSCPLDAGSVVEVQNPWASYEGAGSIVLGSLLSGNLLLGNLLLGNLLLGNLLSGNLLLGNLSLGNLSLGNLCRAIYVRQSGKCRHHLAGR